MLVVLKRILRTALRRRLIREDPTVAVRTLKEPRTEIDPLDPQEIEAFLVACPTWWRAYFALAFWTGARPSELAALKWGDVDWQSQRFRIRAGRYRGVEDTPKTASSVRDVDMLPPAIEAMRTQKAQQAATRLKLGQGAPAVGVDYVFTGPEGGLLNTNFLRDKVWYPALTKAGLRRRFLPDAPHVREQRPGGWRSTVLGRRHARARDPRNALHRLRPLHPEPDAPGRERPARSHGRSH